MDISADTFDTTVIERSRELPVVVDFWAPWCGPCHALAPVLEQAVAHRDGAVELVKVDVDQNPELARRFGISGIPSVKAFREGAVVGQFVGAMPPAAVADFLDGVLASEVAA
jgi:putative thioredoxin